MHRSPQFYYYYSYYCVICIDRLLARLIYLKINLADFRKRLLYLFSWEDVPGEGNTKLREFLKEDYRSQEHFAYLIYDTEDEIDEAKITKDNDNSISITAKNNMFIILRAIPEYTQVEVLVRNDRGKEAPVYHFIISKEDDGDRRGMHVGISIKEITLVTLRNGGKKQAIKQSHRK